MTGRGNVPIIEWCEIPSDKNIMANPMAKRGSANQSAAPREARVLTRRGQFILSPLALVTLLSFTVVASGYWWWTSQTSNRGTTKAILHTVARDNFVLEVIERGEIQSAGLNEVRSLVKSKNTAGTLKRESSVPVTSVTSVKVPSPLLR